MKQAATTSRPEWLASLPMMVTKSRNSRTHGLNWFTWRNHEGRKYVRQAFGTASSYVMEATPHQVAAVDGGWPAAPVAIESYKSAWDLISALDPARFGNRTCGPQLFSGVGGVLYDDEDWSGTPRNERLYPGYYVDMIAYYVHRYNLSHRHKLKFFVAPSLNLSNTVAPVHLNGIGPWAYLADYIPKLVSTPSTKWKPHQYTPAGTHGNFGRYVPDHIDIQAQQLEQVVTGPVTKRHVTYQYLVREAAQQIKAGDPGATLFAGLATNNAGGNGGGTTVAQLTTAAAKVKGIVSGFWMNDAIRTPKCPTCTGTYPNIADGGLNAIDTTSGW